eukprot:TRINITY_DN21754_c0_g3_i2.p1 TRINITY_DN21754_c0_g3~~TRINITY_DN21754_c0_g3_i2.p1  ORF type:complete len:394 (+),score=46.87 TRINITY_DN21754_c0_g3_i2:68-1183(+)
MTQSYTQVGAVKRFRTLFMDDASKDVTFKLADGEERAHRLILQTASEVFRGMFNQDMREKTDGIVELPNVDRIAMRVFLRLIYTGHIDDADWRQLATAGGCNGGFLTHTGFLVQGSTARSQIDCWKAGLILGPARDKVDITITTPDDSTAVYMVGVVPKDTPVSAGMHNTTGAWLYVHSGTVSDFHNTRQRPERRSVPPKSKVRVTYDTSKASLRFYINGSFLPPEVSFIPQPGVAYCPALTVHDADLQFHVEDVGSQPCPVDVLLSVSILAKKYMVKDILSSATQALKSRLEDTKTNKCVRTFEKILAHAISGDMGALRQAALRIAEDFEKLRKEYNSEALKPEVMHELEAIWTPPAGREEDRMSFASLE